MDWTKFSNHGESNNHAFEVMCNILFESWCKETYKDNLIRFAFVNGDGGDGGVEAYASLENDEIIAVQSKWFPEKLGDGQIRQIRDSFLTAVKVRPNISKYIVCIPRDLGSKKIVRGGNIACNTEADKWEGLVSDLKSSYPNVEIILWDETTIQGQLTKTKNQGVYKYWFENTVVFDNLFNLSYEKAFNGWAKSKYIPEIHTAGYIHEKMEYFLGSIELSKRRSEEICKFIKRLEELSRSYKDLLELGIPESLKELQDKIEKDLLIVNYWLKILTSDRDAIHAGERVREINESLRLNCTASYIKDSPLHSGKYFHFKEIENLLEDIEDDFFTLIRLLEETDSNKIIFLGMQGTGKTAGIMAEAANFIHNGVHLPVVIHAKDYKRGDSWSSIICKTLGLNSTWNEIELFGALQNAAFIKGHQNGDFYIVPNCVIIVDGLDEAASWSFWKEKIEETAAFNSEFPRIKFVFLSRPYVFKNRHTLSYRDRFYFLPATGDGDLEEICDKYFSKYNIDIGENLWIKTNLRTPISVKLFSDIYRNKKITVLPKNTVVLTELYKAKISSMEEAYSTNHNGFRGVKVIQTALIELAQLFVTKPAIRYEEIYDCVSAQLKSSLDEILNFLIDEGFIYTYTNQEDDFSVPNTFYSWGIQPAFDYLIAQKIYKSIISGQPLEINQNNGINQMLSLISIENGKLLQEYSNVEINEYAAFELVCYALANCSVTVAEKYTDYLKQLMRSSVAEFREIFSKVIYLVLRIDKHPLGSILLDAFLREFDNPAERDVWWSIPTYLQFDTNVEWRAYTELDFESIKLHSTDKYCAAPLTLVWSLSSVNNIVRQKVRYELTAWGISQPLEYWKLFEKCVSINDFQVLEDIFAIAYGIALDQFICNEYLITASNWFINNLFSAKGLKKFENVALRYYGAGIVKIAISHRLLDQEISKLVTPPYNYAVDCLPLCKDAIDSERMGGYQAIDYDLARYVLCDRLDDFFETDYSTGKYQPQTEAYLNKYSTAYNVPDLKVDGLIISAAYQFLLDQGWNPDRFWSYEDIENLGVDNIIQRTYYPSTHGEISRIMTVSEKYVWIARHKIEAVFANELPFTEDFKTFQFLDDYSKLEDFINTYQDYVNKLHQDKKHEWLNVELLASPDFETIDKEKIENWMDEDCIPPFDKWLSDCNGSTLLYTSTSVRNNLSGVKETLWISSGVIKELDFQQLLLELDTDFEGRYEMLNVCDFHSYQDCRCYCTPQEACLVHSDHEINNSLIITDSKNNIEVFKLTLECLSADGLRGEKNYILPSKWLRALTGIVYGDGFSYSDQNGNNIAFFSDEGENIETYQKTLMINSAALNAGLTDNGLKMFWLFRVYREATLKARERYEELTHYTDRSFIVWIENNNLGYKEFYPIKSSNNFQNPDEAFDFESLLAEYGILLEDESDDFSEDEIITTDEN